MGSIREKNKKAIYTHLRSRKLHSACILCLRFCQTQGWTTKPFGVHPRRRRTSIAWQSSLSYTPDSSDTISKLLDVLEEEECEGLEALELGVDENGLRGVFAKLSFQPGEYICALPFPSSLLLEDNLHSDMNGIYETIQDNSIRQGLRLFQDFVHNNDSDTKYYDG